MATWGTFAAEEPELAARVQAIFDSRRHKALATLRRGGSPRLSGIEIEFHDGEVTFGMMPGSAKLRDLGRDPRLALLAVSADPEPGNERAWAGDARIAGRAYRVGDAWRVDVEEVVLTKLNDRADRLVVESWREGRGVRTIERA